MEKNRLNGTLPVQMGLLTNVMFLSFGDNLITGTIPLSFQNLTRLGKLHTPLRLLKFQHFFEMLNFIFCLVYLSIAGCQLNGSLDNVCSAISSNRPYIAADCQGGQFCPQGCCKTCCDAGDNYGRTCQEGQHYVDPLLLVYALFDRISKNVAW